MGEIVSCNHCTPAPKEYHFHFKEYRVNSYQTAVLDRSGDDYSLTSIWAEGALMEGDEISIPVTHCPWCGNRLGGGDGRYRYSYEKGFVDALKGFTVGSGTVEYRRGYKEGSRHRLVVK